jgi:hypothetical protein
MVVSVATTAYRFFRRFLYDRDQGICGICREPVAFGRSMDIDHVVQLADGGSDDPSNLRITHYQCNRRRPRIAGVRLMVEIPMSDAVALKERADSESFELTPFLIHTLKRMVENRPTPPADRP